MEKNKRKLFGTKLVCKELQFCHYSFKVEYLEEAERLKTYNSILEIMRKFLKENGGLHVNVVPFHKEKSVVCSFLLKKHKEDWFEEISKELFFSKVSLLLSIN